jgi:hypothetical protein
MTSNNIDFFAILGACSSVSPGFISEAFMMAEDFGCKFVIGTRNF